MKTERDVKGVVRQVYGKRAQEAGRGNAAEMCCAATTYYGGSELAGLPDAAVAASAGCGNPLALAELKEGEVVVDLGSGGGIDCFVAAKQVGAGGRVLGVDMTSEMVRLARSNAVKLDASNVQFILAELERIPLADETVDVIISNCVINLSPDKDSVFQEAFRVLRRGGRLHVSDIVLEDALPEKVAGDDQEWAACVAGADLKDVYLERMRRAGFSAVCLREAQAYESGKLAGMSSAKVEAVKA